MDFGEVLSRAWQITWKYKVLWIFGILAGCGGQGGRGSFNFQGNGGAPGGPLPPGLRRFGIVLDRWFSGLSDVEAILLMVGIAVAVLLLVAVVLAASTVGRIGLIRGTLEADQGAAALTFGGLFAQVRPFFWRVLGLNVLLGVVLLLAFGSIAAFAAVFTVLTFGLGVLCLLPLICLLAPAAWFFGIVIEQANVALIADDLSIVESLARGWQVVRENVGPMIVMGLILTLGIGLIGGFIIALPLFLIVFPVFVAMFGDTAQVQNTGLLIAGLCFVLYLPVLLVLAGILRTYIESAWTLTYLRLAAPAAGPAAMLDAPAR